MVEHAIRDQRLEELQCELERRQNMLLEKSFTLNETAKTNDLLESVASDYGKYKDFVVNEKIETFILEIVKLFKIWKIILLMSLKL